MSGSGDFGEVVDDPREAGVIGEAGEDVLGGSEVFDIVVFLGGSDGSGAAALDDFACEVSVFA